DLLLAGAAPGDLVGALLGERDLRVPGAALRQVPAERAASLLQVLDRLVVLARVVERRAVRVCLEHRIRDRNVHDVTELLEVVEGELLHLVGRVAPLEGRPEAVALDGLGEDDRRLALVLCGRLERRVDLAVVVAAALEAPQLVIGVVLHQFRDARVAAEEVLAHVGAALGLVGLVVAIRSDVHEVDERTLAVARQQAVPLATPDDLDDVPAGAAEEALELLDDLAVAANRPVEALQVAVDDEGEVVEIVVRRPLQRAAALDLVHLAVTEEGPDVAVGDILDAAVGQVAVGLSLVDRVDRTDAHRHRGELPELRHEVRVRVRGEATARVRLLLAEAVELVLIETALEEGPGVHAGGGVPLVEHLVAAARVILAAEEVVAADLVQGGRAGVGGDVAADSDTRALGAVHHDRGIPAQPGAVATLDLFVAGEIGFVFGGDGVDVVGGRNHRNTELQILRALQQAEHDLAAALAPVRRDQSIEGFLPFGGFLWILIDVIRRIWVLVVDRHP